MKIENGILFYGSAKSSYSNNCRVIDGVSGIYSTLGALGAIWCLFNFFCYYNYLDRFKKNLLLKLNCQSPLYKFVTTSHTSRCFRFLSLPAPHPVLALGSFHFSSRTSLSLSANTRHSSLLQTFQR